MSAFHYGARRVGAIGPERPDWQELANCRCDSRSFPARTDTRPAKAVCQSCVVRETAWSTQWQR